LFEYILHIVFCLYQINSPIHRLVGNSNDWGISNSFFQSFAVKLGPLVDEATGQNTADFVVTNISQRSCYLNGYPTIDLRDQGGRSLPFTYRHHGDQMVTNARPRPVVLRSGGHAYIRINKYRGDLGDKAETPAAAITPPATGASFRVPLGNRRDFGYCGVGDPGSIVSVSPVVSTADQLHP
jgi:hypothetical protein